MARLVSRESMAPLRGRQLQFSNYYYYVRVGSDVCASLMKLATKTKAALQKGGSMEPLEHPLNPPLVPVYTCVYRLCDFLRPEVQPHVSQMHITTQCSAHVLGQAHPTMLCIF